ncbi:5748_t:CDS:1, partial [Funneliformis geosporum]
MEDEYKESHHFLVEVILDNNQVFNILNCKSFHHLLSSLDKNFIIPYDKTIKTMI